MSTPGITVVSGATPSVTRHDTFRQTCQRPHATAMRLLTILLVTRAVAEWVEISQHHYRKPIKTHSPFTTPKAISTEETAKPWNYNNHSVTEYNWSKTPSRSSNVANIKRVQHGHAVRTTETTLLQSEDIDLDTSDRRHHHRPTEAPAELKVKQKGTIERVPNIGNVKRVQLNESPVKSHPVRVKGDDGNVSTNRMRIYFTDDPRKTEDNFEDKENLETLRRIYVNEVKKGHIIEKTGTFPPKDEDMFIAEEESDFKRVYRNYTSTNVLSPKPTFITETEEFNKFGVNEDRFFKMSHRHVTEKTFLYTTENVEDFSLDAPDTETKVTPPPQGSQNSDEPASTEISNENKVSSGLGHRLDHENPKQPDKRPENNKPKADEAKHKVANNTKTEKNKINSIENVLKFMTVVAETISKNSRKSFGGKVSYLQDLKDSILATIGKSKLPSSFKIIKVLFTSVLYLLTYKISQRIVSTKLGLTRTVQAGDVTRARHTLLLAATSIFRHPRAR